MFNIIIFGTGKTSMVVESGLNNKANIICYCDNDKTKWGRIYRGREICDPKKIKEINFNYIIIASQFEEEIYNQLSEMRIENKKIFQFYKYIDSGYNYVNFKLKEINENNKELSVLATGISYMEKALSVECLCKKCVKLSNHSQDLYFDYNLVKYVLENYKSTLNNLKYVLIGLSYYSFEYDMSKSAMKGKVILYNEIINLKHNLKDINKLKDFKEINTQISEDIFKFNRFKCIDFNWFDNEKNVIKINEENGKKQALIDGNKNYPETVQENIQIFGDYLKLLEDNNIKPIVIVCPVSKYYEKYFPQRLKNEFDSIIKDISQQHNFQFLNYFNNKLFKDSDFYDVTHLNTKGAEKFTKILNYTIEW